MFEGLLSPMHLLVILAIALIVLGPKRLPEAGRGLGEAMRGFRESIAAPRDDAERDAEDPKTPQQ
jgi:sec-independent protein translocase protein TatA